ncbi:MAG: succinate dehydrogenase [Pseudomonadota bacterium]
MRAPSVSALGPHRRTKVYWTFLAHRLSGLALAAFLPMHFLALGLALEGEAALDGMLAWTENPVVKAAEWGLVVLLSIHLFFGTRLLALEFWPWPKHDPGRVSWIVPGAAASLLIGAVFLVQVL